MNNLIFKHYQDTINNQLRLKLLDKNIFNEIKILKITVNIFFKKILSAKNTKVIESLFYLYFLLKNKSYISFFNKKYKEYDLIITGNINKNSYLLFVLTFFMFPMLIRREIFFKKKFNSGQDVIFSTNLYNIFPFLSDLYFTWTDKTSYITCFNSSYKKKNLLCYYYYNYPIKFMK